MNVIVCPICGSVICPICGSKMILMEGKYGKFYGCSEFPDCKYTLNQEVVENLREKVREKTKEKAEKHQNGCFSEEEESEEEESPEAIKKWLRAEKDSEQNSEQEYPDKDGVLCGEEPFNDSQGIPMSNEDEYESDSEGGDPFAK